MTIKFFSLLLVLSGLFLAGCVSPQPPADDLIPYTVLSEGSQSGIAEESYYYFTNANSWNFFVKKYSFSSPPDLASRVDFSNESVIVLAMGQKPSSGYSIAVTKMEWKKKCEPGQYSVCSPVELPTQVAVETKSPNPSEPVLEVVTTPFQIIKVKKVDWNGFLLFKVDGVSKSETPFNVEEPPTGFTRVYRDIGGGFSRDYSRLTLNKLDDQWLAEVRIRDMGQQDAQVFSVTLNENQTQKMGQVLDQVDLANFPGVSEPPCCDRITTYIEIDRDGETYGWRIEPHGDSPNPVFPADVLSLLAVLDEIQNQVLAVSE